MLYQRQSVSADELATEFGVSKITIRRDLDALAGDKFLERTRGGAVSIAGLRLEEFFGRQGPCGQARKILDRSLRCFTGGRKRNDFCQCRSTTLEVIRHLHGSENPYRDQQRRMPA